MGKDVCVVGGGDSALDEAAVLAERVGRVLVVHRGPAFSAQRAAVQRLEAASNVEVQLQRRFDLIDNLVNTVKGIAAQEQKVFGDLAAARAKYGSAATTDDKAKAATETEGALGRLLVIVENYPQLKSQENFLELQRQLASTEDQIAGVRSQYNRAVQDYNQSIRLFPASLIATQLGYHEHEYFKSDPNSTKVPGVDFQ